MCTVPHSFSGEGAVCRVESVLAWVQAPACACGSGDGGCVRPLFRLRERYKRQLGAGHCRSTNAPLTRSSQPLVHRSRAWGPWKLSQSSWTQAGGSGGGGRRVARRPGAAVALTVRGPTPPRRPPSAPPTSRSPAAPHTPPCPEPTTPRRDGRDKSPDRFVRLGSRNGRTRRGRRSWGHMSHARGRH